MTTVQCTMKGRNCGTLRLGCESVNTDLYKLDVDNTLFTSTTSRAAKCPKSYYMVGMKCESGFSGYCNSFSLQCTKIRFRNLNDCGVLDDDEGPPPPPNCKDLRFSSGQKWEDRDQNEFVLGT